MRGRQAWWVAALATIAVTALAIRVARLGAEPFWLDEVCTRNFSAGTVSSVLTAYARDVHPPLYGILLHCWQATVDTSEEALRGYSSLWSIVGLLCAALLARDVTGSRSVGLAAGLVLAVNPLDIWYAQEARMYAQGACLTTVASWVLWRWLRSEGPTRERWRLASAYGFLAALSLYTHYLAAVVLACQALAALALFSARRRWRDTAWLLGAGGAAAASLVPWLTFVHRFRSGLYDAAHVGWIPKPHVAEVFGFLNHEVFLGFASAPVSAAAWFPVVTGVLLVVVVAAAASTGPMPTIPPAHRTRDALPFLLCLTVGPPLLAAVISGLWHPVYFRPRFSLFCLAPTVVALVVLLARARPPLRTLLLGALAGLMAVGTAWQTTSFTKGGLRELARLGATFGEPEFVLLLPSPNSILVHYYLPNAKVQPSAEALAARLHGPRSATVWVGLKDGQLPPMGTRERELVSWLATTGPYRLLGQADGFSVWELHAQAIPTDRPAGSPKWPQGVTVPEPGGGVSGRRRRRTINGESGYRRPRPLVRGATARSRFCRSASLLTTGTAKAASWRM